MQHDCPHHPCCLRSMKRIAFSVLLMPLSLIFVLAERSFTDVATERERERSPDERQIEFTAALREQRVLYTHSKRERERARERLDRICGLLRSWCRSVMLPAAQTNHKHRRMERRAEGVYADNCMAASCVNSATRFHDHVCIYISQEQWREHLSDLLRTRLRCKLLSGVHTKLRQAQKKGFPLLVAHHRPSIHINRIIHH